MEIKSIFYTILLFVIVVFCVVTLGDEFDSTGRMNAEDMVTHNAIKTNLNINYQYNINQSNTQLENMRNRLQQENKENSFAFQFSQALVWTYDLLIVINTITHITTTLIYFIGFQNTFVLAFFGLIDWLINFVLGFSIWKAIFK